MTIVINNSILYLILPIDGRCWSEYMSLVSIMCDKKGLSTNRLPYRLRGQGLVLLYYVYLYALCICYLLYSNKENSKPKAVG